MAHGSWDPFKDLLSLQERMNQLFEESLARRSGLRPQVEQWQPPVDIVDTADAVILTAELPGLEIHEITLEVANRYLTLRGDRLFSHGCGSEHYYQLERVYGKFERVFPLPDEVDSSRIKAALRDGVLEITLPKRPTERSCDIPVHVPSP
jgi:HSP20 family protein